MSGQGGARVEFANTVFASGVNLGAADNCQPGGGVPIFSSAKQHILHPVKYRHSYCAVAYRDTFFSFPPPPQGAPEIGSGATGEGRVR